MSMTSKEQDSIVLRIDRKTPLTLERLTFGMMAMGAEYEKFIQSQHPNAEDHEADLLVQRVKEGSIVIELVGALAPIFQGMNNIIIFEQFTNLVKGRLSTLSKPNGRLDDTSPRELENLARMVETVAGDSGGTGEMLAVQYNSDSGEKHVTASIFWKAKDAEQVVSNARAQIREIRGGESDKQCGLLMHLFQTNISEAVPDRSSGEKGIIESISPKPKRLIYASDLAGQRIKGAWSDERISPYDLGFVVDVDVQMVNGRPSAYRILEVHDVFPLEGDDE
ncbi:hypothetical protein [Rhodovulum sp. YEN HP10]|uniref:hypothetical protein n=1 Tax=Rhodovulum sp. HP10 TaxID=3387397 RepID=UPI0039E04F65